ncbi:MAG TPA: hypothetical protein VD927_03790 [Chryseosolibacter sp.]|nr:hypothetical protein [Chryseosolibacter sp.]
MINYRTILTSLMRVILISVIMTSCDTDKDIASPVGKFFMKYYGGDGDQISADIIESEDGNFILVGSSGNRSSFELSSRIYVCKVTPEGRLIWEKVIGEAGDLARDIEPIGGDRYVILADHRASAINIDPKLIRIDTHGERIDSVTYFREGIQRSKSVTPLEDQGFIVTGSTEYDSLILLNPGNPDDLSDIFHYRCNSSLQFDRVNWYEQGGSGTFDMGIRTIEEPGAGFFVFGASNQTHAGNQEGKVNLYYSVINDGGVTGDLSFLGDFTTDTESSFVVTVPSELGGGYLLTGTKNYPTGASRIQLTKLRPNLNFDFTDEQWDMEVQLGERNLTAVSATPSLYATRGYFVLADETSSDGRKNIWLTKVNTNGGEVWSRFFGSREEDDTASRVLELADGSILVLGTTGLINGQSKITLFKLNPEGQLAE